ncbi:MAG: CPBP family intramembrane glutamic endopeptidase [Corynebacterium sp.]|uniref:CPBP family intramembrane glutamic endopeptidase n=1 Tax=unclassified Corynebacterium TaxID=2624378 RepID=UPI00264A34E7|nr:CPBP family intramembrane glutamic endopeptidase [Corynebacterium sp.]MDN5720415.1 CPBP family intramembrane metalloprotease [Corynebacterium sp.]MDN6260046.1 CPBP family intramembrane metalloprotease [Corynebacterium sp.]MDN6324899.1 CPBP family intramembrane metalloprotease [Corynebacterium sp.]MDN6510176.1 CPBP family intramembrane metalloprotease [Corynebacterium sp.]
MTGTQVASAGPADRRAIRWELLIVLAVTFGASGVRSALRLLEAATRPENLNEQTTTLNARQSTLAWLDPAFQLISTGVLVAWGGLALFLLLRHVPPTLSLRPRWRDALPGAGLAALIGVPGLAFYVGAVQLGLSKEVVPTGLDRSVQDLVLLVLNSWANGFAEEILVVAWLCCRLRQLRVPWVWVFLASAVLRGSYHLYQGYSAGLGNMVMGLVFVWFFYRTGRVWPLVIAHGLIDTVAFVGYQVLGSTPGL